MFLNFHNSFRLYKGQPTVEEIKHHMEELGFVGEKCWPSFLTDLYEYNCIFARPEYIYPVHHNSQQCFTEAFAQDANAIGLKVNVHQLEQACCLGEFDINIKRPKIIRLLREELIPKFCWKDPFGEPLPAYSLLRCCVSDYLRHLRVIDQNDASTV